MAFDIPLESGSSNKIENVELIPVGMNLCTLYGVSDLGTQSTKFGNKRQIKLAFEFPLERRVFWEGDEAKPSVISTEETMSLAEKANLRKRWIEPMTNIKLGNEQGFDPTTLIGKNFVATVTHSPDGKWANISSIAPLDERNMKLFDLTTPSYPLVNTSYKFHLDDTFDSEAFASLPKNVRAKLRESTEGEVHLKSGGVFREPVKTEQANTGTAPGGMGTNGKKLVMNPGAQYSYDALKGMNWTDDQIVEQGHATWQQATPPPATAQAPSATPPPAAAQPTPPPATPPSQPQHKVKMKDPEQQGLIDQWLTSGWTYELLVEHGHADFI